MPGPLRLGSLVLQPVSDGALRLDPSSIFADAPADEWRPRVPLDEHGNVELALTCLLVEAGGQRILVDTGYGPRPDNPAVGHLGQELAKLGLSAADIEMVVVSHPHGDHIGGATTGAGEEARATGLAGLTGTTSARRRCSLNETGSTPCGR